MFDEGQAVRLPPTPVQVVLDFSKAASGRLQEVTTGTGMKLEYRGESIPAEDARVLRIGDGRFGTFQSCVEDHRTGAFP